jgi:hypothetical protein
MEAAILAVLSMAAGSGITGFLLIFATRREKARVSEIRKKEHVFEEPKTDKEDGKIPVEKQLESILDYKGGGGIRVR